MTPYYSDRYVTLFHGDAFKIDAWLSAGVLVTDPPFGIGWKQGDYNGAGRRSPDRIHAGIAGDDNTAARDAALGRWGPNRRPSIIFGSPKASPPAGLVQTLVWRKPVDSGVVGSTLGYRNDFDLIFLCGPHIHRRARRSAILESRGGMGRYRNAHPHAKPPLLIEQLIEWTAGVVADPFAGSGSTLIAARNLGRRAIGVEIHEPYCELAATRLAQMTLDFEAGA